MRRYIRSLEHPKPTVPRKVKVTPLEIKKILDANKADPNKTAAELHRELEFAKPISVQTLRNVLRKNGLRACRINKQIVYKPQTESNLAN